MNKLELKKRIAKLKKELFADPEPCCHGVTKREAEKIIDKIFGDTYE